MTTKHNAGLELLLSRYSIGAKHLGEPGPSDDDLQQMTAAALRAPDHAGLVPFRLAAIRGEARQALAALFERAALEAGKDASSCALDRDRALQAPLTVAVIARIDQGHPLAPVHEQWMAVGGAVSNFLSAAHALGYGGKMLSGSKVRSAPVVAAFCEAGETLVGWIVLGTPQRGLSPKHRKPATGEVMRDWKPR